MTPCWPDSPDAPRFARQRRERLAERLRDCGLDGALITDAREILYFTGAPLATPAPACLLLTLGGSDVKTPRSVLVCGRSDRTHHVDETHAFDWHTGGSIHTDLVTSMTARATAAFVSAPSRIGVQFESLPAALLKALPGHGSGAVGIDADISDLHRNKDGLEIAAISAAVTADRAALAAAKLAIGPGVSEIEVFAAACRAATLAAGRPIHHDGDYRCGAPGGPASDRRTRGGDLYIIDAWTRCDGYWADLARTHGVSAELSPLQSDLLAHVACVHGRIEPLLRPGVPCHDLWLAIDAALREFPPLADTGLTHHGGHGIGLRLHETPDIHHGSPDVLRAGDVVCIEPGGYIAEARAGARIEQMYRITDRGPACMSIGGPNGGADQGR